MILTSREKLILKDNLERGYIFVVDFYKYFASRQVAIEKVNRLLSLGVIQEGENFRLIINKKVLNEEVSSL